MGQEGGGRREGEEKRKEKAGNEGGLIHYSCTMPDRKQPAGWWRTTGFRSVLCGVGAEPEGRWSDEAAA